MSQLNLSSQVIQEIAILARKDSKRFDALLSEFAPDEQLELLDAVLDAPDPTQKPAPPAPLPAPIRKPGWISSDAGYAAKLERDRQRQRKLAESGRDIGPIPAVVDVRRRHRCRYSLLDHLSTYHASVYNRPWAGYHIAIAERIESAIFRGGWFALAVPRGGGKTAMCEGAVEWALLHGHKRWPLLIGPTEDKALASLKNLKTELSLNPLLLDDFPDVCFAIAALDGSARRCEGQLCCGVPTLPYWGTHKIILPTISPEEWERWVSQYDREGVNRPVRVGGHRLGVGGLTGSLRGQSEKTAELEMIRPDFALADDPQTRESAKSYSQSEYRRQILTGDIAYLSGGQQKMSVVVPCTVIYRGDMADQLLDRTINPEWRAERHKMLISMPDRMDLWDQYAEIRRDCLRQDLSTQAATDFYIANREEMDRGAEASWPERFFEDEVSAIQHAMNLKIRDEVSFQAEGQNEPIADAQMEAVLCSINTIMKKFTHVGQYVVPHYAAKLAAHIDVQASLLYYTVAAASLRFETAVIDYGSVPDQKRTFFTMAESLRTLADEFPGYTPDVQLYRGIQAAIAMLATRLFRREDGAEMSIGRITVDCGFMSATVIKACRESPFSGVVLPVQGISVRAKDQPFVLRKRKDGETKGHGWIIKPKPDTPSVLYGQVDANFWKTQVHGMFNTPVGDGSLSLWKDRGERHRMFALHCHGENPTLVEANENKVVEWDLKPEHPDNHHFDNIANCLAALSMQGCVLPSHEEVDTGYTRTPKVVTRDSLMNRRR